MSKVKQYRKKPVVIEAILYAMEAGDVSIEEAQDRVADFIGANISVTADDKIEIDTLEEVITADIGDYIIKGVKGEFYPCEPVIFEATYEEVKS